MQVEKGSEKGGGLRADAWNKKIPRSQKLDINQKERERKVGKNSRWTAPCRRLPEGGGELTRIARRGERGSDERKKKDDRWRPNRKG